MECRDLAWAILNHIKAGRPEIAGIACRPLDNWKYLFSIYTFYRITGFGNQRGLWICDRRFVGYL